MSYTIYGIVCPDTKNVVYVGLTNNIKNRFRSHLCSRSNIGRKLKEWLLGIDKRGLRGEIEIIPIEENINKPDVLRKEKEYILLYNNISPLLNGNKTGAKKIKRPCKSVLIDIDENTEKKLSHLAIDAGLKLKPFIEDILQRVAAGKIKI